MPVEHNVIIDSERHEPKGADAATAGQVFVSDGSNSGVFTVRKIILTASIDDISTANSFWTVSPIAGNITKIYSVIDTTITTGDATLTFELGGTVVTGSSITIAFSGSVPGTVDSSSPSAANTVAAGDAIEIITDGGSTVASRAEIIIEITGTAVG